MDQKNTDRVLDLILGSLEKLNINQDRLAEEIKQTNIELIKIGSLQNAVLDFKEWKDDIENVVNADDLKDIKKFYSSHQDINTDISDLYSITKELKDITEDYKKFKIKTMTIVSVISFLFSTALVLVAKFFH